MALKPTIYKVALQLADIDRGIYETIPLTLARHPSETFTRMMVRLLVYGVHYHPDLQFSRGLSSTDEPDLWQLSPSGEVLEWIELGQASPERMRKANSRAPQLYLYAYGDDLSVWWRRQGAELSQLPKLQVWQFDPSAVAALDLFEARTMQLSLTICEGELSVSDGEHHQTLALSRLGD